VESLQNPSLVGWGRLYNLTFLVGILNSGSAFWALNCFFLPPGLKEETDFFGGPVIATQGYDLEGRDPETHNSDRTTNIVQETKEKSAAISDVSL